MQVADTVGVALNTECVVFTGSEEKRGSTSSRAGGLHITLRVHVVKSIHKQQTTSIGKPQRKPTVNCIDCAPQGVPPIGRVACSVINLSLDVSQVLSDSYIYRITNMSLSAQLNVFECAPEAKNPKYPKVVEGVGGDTRVSRVCPVFG